MKKMYTEIRETLLSNPLTLVNTIPMEQHKAQDHTQPFQPAKYDLFQPRITDHHQENTTLKYSSWTFHPRCRRPSHLSNSPHVALAT